MRTDVGGYVEERAWHSLRDTISWLCLGAGGRRVPAPQKPSAGGRRLQPRARNPDTVQQEIPDPQDHHMRWQYHVAGADAHHGAALSGKAAQKDAGRASARRPRLYTRQ